MSGNDRWSLASRVKRLERTPGANLTNAAYQFVASPTCPPSTAITIRGGMAVAGAYWVVLNASAVVPDNTCDFADTDDTELSCNFANANYYIGLVLGYHSDYLMDLGFGTYSGPRFKCAVGSTTSSAPTEWATAAEAETYINRLMNGLSRAIYMERLPLTALVLRNDGRTGVSGAILPIDAINRGRSYLYMDARPSRLGQA